MLSGLPSASTMAAVAAAGAASATTIPSSAALRGGRRSASMRRSSRSPGEVLLAGSDGHGLILAEVAHLDHALGDAGQRALAVVLREPLGAAHGRRAVAAARAEPPAAAAPQAPPAPRRRLADRGSAGPTLRLRPVELERRDRLGALRLADPEDAVVEVR